MCHRYKTSPTQAQSGGDFNFKLQLCEFFWSKVSCISGIKIKIHHFMFLTFPASNLFVHERFNLSEALEHQLPSKKRTAHLKNETLRLTQSFLAPAAVRGFCWTSKGKIVGGLRRRDRLNPSNTTSNLRPLIRSTPQINSCVAAIELKGWMVPDVSSGDNRGEVCVSRGTEDGKGRRSASEDQHRHPETDRHNSFFFPVKCHFSQTLSDRRSL